MKNILIIFRQKFTLKINLIKISDYIKNFEKIFIKKNFYQKVTLKLKKCYFGKRQNLSLFYKKVKKELKNFRYWLWRGFYTIFPKKKYDCYAAPFSIHEYLLRTNQYKK